MKKTTVLIADDHPIVAMAVQDIIERDARFEVVGVASGPSQLIQLHQQLAPNVVIADYSMPGDETYGDGLQMIEYLCRRFSDTRVLVFTMLSNPLIVGSLYDLGVWGVIPKSGDFNEINLALQALSRDRKYQAPARALPTVDNQLHARIARLTVREYEVLRHFISGLSGREIAALLHRSTKTISAQKVSAMHKLGVDNDQALLAFCAEAQLFM
ncbi:response regulator [Pseudomonas syringae]|uniref:Response regulator n=1 Tax=Pseudomonas syringae TaxID=317 RepID=A0A9Q3ZYJ4_PSESX|nr:response regulator [Pseudomonas syringae]MCF5065126.1 response regulator [Pseudomonas syringae]MCF5071943.1 response regulator [Pseudomonas syringae]MCF5116934.1 response regulator [Pseudomonas syringae]MCF5376838.1 response regulator [Pseudomonas syringae]